MSNPFNWTGAAISGAGLWDQLDRYDDIGGFIDEELTALGDQVQQGSQFQPFGVAGQFGGAQVDGNGNITYASNAAEAANAEARGQQAGMFFDQAAGGYDAYQQDVYDSVRAMQMPEEQRQQSQLESRLQAQGRGGITSNQYGGSPEQLAMAKAIGENMNNAAFQAIEQGRAQQMQDANLGGMYQTAQYMPQAQMQNMFNQGLQGAQLVQAGQLGGNNLAAQIGLGRINSTVNNEKIRAELMGGLFNQVGGAFTNSNTDPLGGFFRSLLGL